MCNFLYGIRQLLCYIFERKKKNLQETPHKSTVMGQQLQDGGKTVILGLLEGKVFLYPQDISCLQNIHALGVMAKQK